MISPRNVTRRDPTALIQWTERKNLELPLCVFNVYRPPTNPGPSSTHTQAATTIRELGLGETGGTVTEYFYATLRLEVGRALGKGMEVIIGGDFNEAHIPTSKTTNRLNSISFVNITPPPVGPPTPPTFKGGKGKLDHIWVSG